MLKVANIFEDGRLSGGPQRRIANVAKPLYAMGIDTIVVIPKDESEEYVQYLQARGVEYFLFDMTRPTKKYSQVVRYFLMFSIEIIKLAFYFRKNSIDLVHVSGGSWQIKGVIAGILAGKKVIWHLNDAHVPNAVYKVFTFLRGHVQYFFIASKKVENYYFPDKKPLQKYFIGAPVDCSRFSPEIVEPVVLPQAGFLNVITVAQISPIKNLDLLVDIASMVSPEIKFHFVGPVFPGQKDYLNQVKSRIVSKSVNNIVFHTMNCLDPERYYKAADVYFCTSKSEASPTAVWEAMSMCLPVISTDVSDLNEVSKTNKQLSLKVYHESDLQGFCNAFETLLENKKQQDILANSENRVYVKNNFDLSMIVDKHKRAYEEIAGVAHAV